VINQDLGRKIKKKKIVVHPLFKLGDFPSRFY